MLPETVMAAETSDGNDVASHVNVPVKVSAPAGEMNDADASDSVKLTGVAVANFGVDRHAAMANKMAIRLK
jgi:hypothetical protein